jgi:hypothetical protein
MLCHLADYNCLSDMIQLFVFAFFFFASTLIVFLFSCPHFILKILEGMDQTQEGISHGLSWMCSSYWMAMAQAMAYSM